MLTSLRIQAGMPKYFFSESLRALASWAGEPRLGCACAPPLLCREPALVLGVLLLCEEGRRRRHQEKDDETAHLRWPSRGFAPPPGGPESPTRARSTRALGRTSPAELRSPFGDQFAGLAAGPLDDLVAIRAGLAAETLAQLTRLRAWRRAAALPSRTVASLKRASAWS